MTKKRTLLQKLMRLLTLFILLMILFPVAGSMVFLVKSILENFGWDCLVRVIGCSVTLLASIVLYLGINVNRVEGRTWRGR